MLEDSVVEESSDVETVDDCDADDSDDDESSETVSLNSQTSTSLFANLAVSGIVTLTFALTVKVVPLIILPLSSTRKPSDEYNSDNTSNDDKSVVLTGYLILSTTYLISLNMKPLLLEPSISTDVQGPTLPGISTIQLSSPFSNDPLIVGSVSDGVEDDILEETVRLSVVTELEVISEMLEVSEVISDDTSEETTLDDKTEEMSVTEELDLLDSDDETDSDDEEASLAEELDSLESDDETDSDDEEASLAEELDSLDSDDEDRVSGGT